MLLRTVWSVAAGIAVCVSPGDGLAQGTARIGEYVGSVSCPAGPVFVTLTTEPGGGRLELADGPGEPPWALGYTNLGQVYDPAGKPALGLVVPTGSWAYRPMDTTARFGAIDYGVATPEEGGDGLITANLGDCGPFRLARVSPERASGGFVDIAQVSRRFSGTLGCSQQGAGMKLDPVGVAMTLTLEPVSPTEFEGRVDVVLRADPDRPVAHRVFGEYDPETGTLIVIGDAWIEESRYLPEQISFEARLLRGGARLVGATSDAQCGIVDLVAGDEPARSPGLPAPPALSPLAWDTPAACVSLIGWAEQVLAESGGRSPYDGMYWDEAARIGVGLFTDERFVPWFGKPFADLTAEERERVLDLRQGCRFLSGYDRALSFSGAATYLDEFFPERNANLWLELKRYALLSKRLTREMEALEAEAVGEADIARLTALRDEVSERFADLWSVDRAGALALIAVKLEIANGDLAGRLATAIEALPLDLGAFRQARAIERDMGAMTAEGAGEHQAVRNALDGRLQEAADAALASLAAELSALPPEDPATLDALRSGADAASQVIGAHVPTGGPGLAALRVEAERIAKMNLAAFDAQVSRMIDPAAQFEEREWQYGDVVRFAARAVPASSLVADRFAAYHARVEALRPEPTRDDQVLADGSPSAFGLKLAVSEFVGAVWGMEQSFLPFDLSALTGAVRVARVDRTGCAPAEAGGYWCDFQLQLDGSMPFLPLFGSLPSQARVEFAGERWSVVETPPAQAPSASGAAAIEEADRQQQSWLEEWNQMTLEGLMMDP